MKALYVRELTSEEKQALEEGLCSHAVFTVRCCQMLLSSARGLKAQAIAKQLHCSAETLRAAIQAFHREGVACLKEKSRHPQSTTFSFSPDALARLPDMVAASLRALWEPHSLWSLECLAAVCHQEGLTDRVVSYETMRDALCIR